MIQKSPAGWHLENSYATLPAEFFVRQAPTRVRAPAFALFNTPLATELGLDAQAFSTTDGAQVFSGNTLPPGSDPLAQAYAGHQYGHFTMLGDGRAILLGEQIAPDGKRFDIQLKGAGRTPFSRNGDGRAALAPMLREYIISEAMHALGIPTTRSLAVVLTSEDVMRETALPGAVLTRVAASHIRIGTFEFAAARLGRDGVKNLADYTIQRHDPDLAGADNPYLALLENVCTRQAKLMAQWLAVGFIHGVMNTDNISISGETIDYGPCAFMDVYDPATVYSSIDRHGRYAYGNQPRIAQWNLARLAEALLPLFDADQDKAIARAEETIENFTARFEAEWLTAMRRKVGLAHAEDADAVLIADLLKWMHEARRDYTSTFRQLDPRQPDAPESTLSTAPPSDWRQLWQTRLQRQDSKHDPLQIMQAVNPAVIPRNHKVEQALNSAQESDFATVHALLAAVARPFEETPGNAPYRQPPAPEDEIRHTFCGT